MQNDVAVVGGLPTSRITRRELAQQMVRDCQTRSPTSPPKLVFSSNGQGVSLAGRSTSFAETMLKADIIHADGMSVVIASRLFGKKSLPERISTTDFFDDAAENAIAAGLSFFILGGSERQNSRAVEVMLERYPGLKIAGRKNGYFSREQDAEVCREIRDSGADVLWVAMGKPLQEEWSVQNKENLRGIGWIKTCGGLYGHLIGDETRAPDWMQRYGLEWLYRALQNPRRLGWRYIVTNPHALWCMARNHG